MTAIPWISPTFPPPIFRLFPTLQPNAKSHLQRNGTLEQLLAKLALERLMLMHGFDVTAQRVYIRCRFVTL